MDRVRTVVKTRKIGFFSWCPIWLKFWGLVQYSIHFKKVSLVSRYFLLIPRKYRFNGILLFHGILMLKYSYWGSFERTFRKFHLKMKHTDHLFLNPPVLAALNCRFSVLENRLRGNRKIAVGRHQIQSSASAESLSSEVGNFCAERFWHLSTAQNRYVKVFLQIRLQARENQSKKRKFGDF